MAPPIVELTNESFHSFVERHERCVIHFWAGWNAHDREMRSLLEELAPEFEHSIVFGSLDTDPPAHHGLCQSLGIVNLPFVASFRKGGLVDSFTGLRSRDALRQRLGALVSD